MKNFTKEELSKMTVDQLVKLATECSIVGRHKMKKCELIDSLMACMSAQEVQGDNSNDITQPADESSTEEVSEVKMKYLDNIEPGTIVAFKVMVRDNVKVKSAAVENISTKRKILKLVNKVGVEYIVPFSDIVWVRTTTRWPKAVYELLKGIRTYGEERCAAPGGCHN